MSSAMNRGKASPAPRADDSTIAARDVFSGVAGDGVSKDTGDSLDGLSDPIKRVLEAGGISTRDDLLRHLKNPWGVLAFLRIRGIGRKTWPEILEWAGYKQEDFEANAWPTVGQQNKLDPEYVGLGTRAANCLRNLGIQTKEEAVEVLASDWRAVMHGKNMGKVCFLEICKWAGVDDPRG